MSTLPNSLITASCSFSRELRSSTSLVTRSERLPSASISFAAFSTCSARRELATTSAPASASPSAIALPMPVVPPVTTATLPLKSKRSAVICFLYQIDCALPVLPLSRPPKSITRPPSLALARRHASPPAVLVLLPLLRNALQFHWIEYGTHSASELISTLGLFESRRSHAPPRPRRGSHSHHATLRRLGRRRRVQRSPRSSSLLRHAHRHCHRARRQRCRPPRRRLHPPGRRGPLAHSVGAVRRCRSYCAQWPQLHRAWIRNACSRRLQRPRPHRHQPGQT